MKPEPAASSRTRYSTTFCAGCIGIGLLVLYVVSFGPVMGLIGAYVADSKYYTMGVSTGGQVSEYHTHSLPGPILIADTLTYSQMDWQFSTHWTRDEMLLLFYLPLSKASAYVPYSPWLLMKWSHMCGASPVAFSPSRPIWVFPPPPKAPVTAPPPPPSSALSPATSP